MAAPTPYSLSYDFTAFQAGSPTTPLPADKLEIEYNNLSTTTDEIIANLGLIQRSDGALTNEIVTRESLASDVVLGVTSPTPWVTATAYVLNDSVTYDNKWYICLVAHTSGTFATDLGNSYWQQLIDLSVYQVIDSYIQDGDADTAVETERTADDDTIYLKCGGFDVVVANTVASAVNELTITNAATGSGPALSATGDDTNIDIELSPKGTGDNVLNNSTVAQRKRVAEATTQTFALADANTLQESTSASTVTWTVPPNSTVAFDTDTEIEVFVTGAGTLTLTAGTGVTINGVTAGSIDIEQYYGGVLKKTATNTWIYLGHNQAAWA